MPVVELATVVVSEYDRPRRFVDEQTSGPSAHLRHEHRFESVGEGTRMVDRFDFASPAGPLGTALDALVLRRYPRRLLRARRDHLVRVAESDQWRRYLPEEG